MYIYSWWFCLDTHVGDISIAFNTGLTVGAFTWGLLVDILGRRWCFNITCLFAAVFGCLFALPSSYALICFFTFMIGFGVGGNIPIDGTITIEFLPKNRRFLLAALSAFQVSIIVHASESPTVSDVKLTRLAYRCPRSYCHLLLPRSLLLLRCHSSLMQHRHYTMLYQAI